MEKVFEVNPNDIYHIHGSAIELDSLIFGHASHPEKALRELKEQKMMKPIFPDHLPRVKELYAIEDVLYHTDKHVEDNIDWMCAAFFQKGLHVEDIDVLGHSFDEADFAYFQYIDRVTRCGCDYNSLSAVKRLDQRFWGQVINGSSEDHLKNVIAYDHPLALKDIGVNSAPQSYCYISLEAGKNFKY